MHQFLDNWDVWLATVSDPEIRGAAVRDREGFVDEHERFDLGRRT